MTFMPPISAPIVAPIATPGGAVVPWYLLGGVTAAQCAVAYQPKGAADLATSYTNLAHPGTNDAAPGTAPTFAAATGWTFAALTSSWLDTGILPTATTSAIIRFSDVGGLFNCAFGSYSGNNTTRFAFLPTYNGIHYYEHANNVSVSGNLTSGVAGIAAQQGYLNGVADGGTIGGTWSGTATATIGIAKQNGYTQYGVMKVQAVAIYNITLSSTQVGLIAAAMAAL